MRYTGVSILAAFTLTSRVYAILPEHLHDSLSSTTSAASSQYTLQAVGNQPSDEPDFQNVLETDDELEDDSDFLGISQKDALTPSYPSALLILRKVVPHFESDSSERRNIVGLFDMAMASVSKMVSSEAKSVIDDIKYRFDSFTVSTINRNGPYRVKEYWDRYEAFGLLLASIPESPKFLDLNGWHQGSGTPSTQTDPSIYKHRLSVYLNSAWFLTNRYCKWINKALVLFNRFDIQTKHEPTLGMFDEFKKCLVHIGEAFQAERRKIYDVVTALQDDPVALQTSIQLVMNAMDETRHAQHILKNSLLALAVSYFKHDLHSESLIQWLYDVWFYAHYKITDMATELQNQ
ncbi:hypothetical protein MT418_000255 [Batrachochytrium dendrobatidis]